MKIALIGPTPPFRGGIAHYTVRLYDALRARGHDPHIVSYRSLYPDILFPGTTQIDTSQVVFDAPSDPMISPTNPATWLAASRRIASLNPDRVIFAWWHPFFAPCCRAISHLCSRAGLSVTLQCHNVRPHEPTPLDDLLLRLAYGGAHGFCVQSQAEARRLRPLAGSKPIRVAPHPPYDQFAAAGGLGPDQWRQRLGVTQSRVVLFFGLVRPYKGVDCLLEAFARLPKSADAGLVIAGESYANLDLEAQARTLGIDERVYLHDAYVPNEDVAGLFDLADACVLPYYHATGSGVANIALARGVPLVVSDLPDLRESLGDHALWASPGDRSTFARHIQHALDAPKSPTTASATWERVVDAVTAPNGAAPES